MTAVDARANALHLLPTEAPICLIAPDGSAQPDQAALPDDDVLVSAYRLLVKGRRFDRQATALTKQGRLAVYPSSNGQEACQVGAVMALRDTDWIFPTYRESVALVTRGVPPGEVLTLLRGDWHCGYDPYTYRAAPQCTPLATQALHAVGVAFAAKARGEDDVALAFLGDGATSEGDTHEALNFAAVMAAPVVFLVQNNGYAISVPRAKQTKAPTLAHKAVGYGMPGKLVDGNDVAAVISVVREAAEKAREGGGPTLVEALTYRTEAHTNADDATRYRPEGEAEVWEPRDPIVRLRSYLLSRGRLPDAIETEILAEAEEHAATVRAAMNAEAELDPLELFDHVYEQPTPALTEQRSELAARLALDAGDEHTP